MQIISCECTLPILLLTFLLRVQISSAACAYLLKFLSINCKFCTSLLSLRISIIHSERKTINYCFEQDTFFEILNCATTAVLQKKLAEYFHMQAKHNYIWSDFDLKMAGSAFNMHQNDKILVMNEWMNKYFS